MASINEPAQTIRHEHLLPAFAMLAVFALLEILPGRLRILPTWLFYLSAAVILAPMVAVAVSPEKARWMRVERAVLFFFVILGTAINVVALGQLIVAITVHPDTIGGIPLLSSSIGIWATNTLVFSLLFWEVDRGGPYARATNVDIKPDWLFPQTGTPEAVPPDWRPLFLDYLFLGYCTATAFSPTDVLPLTRRAKMLMMLESAISLVTIVIVAARAINILK